MQDRGGLFLDPEKNDSFNKLSLDKNPTSYYNTKYDVGFLNKTQEGSDMEKDKEAIREYAKRLAIASFNIDKIYAINEQKTGMKESELCLMYALDDGEPHSQKWIAEEWRIPKTTLNTIVKQWEREGLLTLSTIPGKRREMQISLTEKGKELCRRKLGGIYQAEEIAVAETIGQYSTAFVEATEYYEAALQRAFDSLEADRRKSR